MSKPKILRRVSAGRRVVQSVRRGKRRFSEKELARATKIQSALRETHAKESSDSSCGGAYWYVGVPNFGDALARPILEFVSGRTVEWVSPEQSGKLLLIGSNHHWIRPNDYVCGTGSMYPVAFSPANSVKIFGLRGPLTWKLLGKPKCPTMGDPGLLARTLVEAKSGAIAKTKEVVVVPHVSDTEMFLERWPSLPVVDPRGEPLEVIKQIAQAEFVVASSLHALVVADSFRIPCVWIDRIQKPAGTHKFLDYFHSTGRTTERYPRHFDGNFRGLQRFALPAPHFDVLAVSQAVSACTRAFLRTCEGAPPTPLTKE